MKILQIGLISFISVAWLAGCEGQKINKQWVKQTGNLIVEMKLEPNPPKINQDTKFTVFIKDTKEQPVTDATVKLSLEMTNMEHPEGKVTLKPSQPAGTYEGIGRFDMLGQWDLVTQVQSSKENGTVTFTQATAP